MEGNGIAELKAWLARNKDAFETYTIDEIVNLAIACGFDRSSIAQWATSKKFKEAI